LSTLRKWVSGIQMSALVGGALFVILYTVLTIQTYREATACCAASWSHSTYWWLIASKAAVTISSLLVTAAFAAVYQRRGSSPVAPLLYGASFVILDIPVDVVFRNVGKMDGDFWPAVTSWGLQTILPALFVSAILLAIEYRASAPNQS
jgi:hypothetical protein